MTLYNNTEAMDVQKLITEFFTDNDDFGNMLKDKDGNLSLLARELKNFLMDSILDEWLNDNIKAEHAK